MAAPSPQITHLFRKPHHRSPLRSLPQIQLTVNHGIEGDINAHPITPRQVLLVRLEDLHSLAIPPGSLRENIVLMGLERDRFQPGALLQFQGGTAIRLTFPCEPCKHLSHLVPAFHTLQGKRGILGVVTTGGTLQTHESVQVQCHAFPALPEKPYDRFRLLLSQVPSGKVITYKQIIQSIGVSDSYYRVIPQYLKKAAQSGYPVHRILTSNGALIPSIPDQIDRLTDEGINIIQDQTDSKKNHHHFINLEHAACHSIRLY